jgi:hypothetical protein
MRLYGIDQDNGSTIYYATLTEAKVKAGDMKFITEYEYTPPTKKELVNQLNQYEDNGYWDINIKAV